MAAEFHWECSICKYKMCKYKMLDQQYIDANYNYPCPGCGKANIDRYHKVFHSTQNFPEYLWAGHSKMGFVRYTEKGARYEVQYGDWGAEIRWAYGELYMEEPYPPDRPKHWEPKIACTIMTKDEWRNKYK